MNELRIKINLTKMTYFGNTRSKVAGAFLPVTSYFYV